jgi:hypothetical protein
MQYPLSGGLPGNWYHPSWYPGAPDPDLGFPCFVPWLQEGE